MNAFLISPVRVAALVGVLALASACGSDSRSGVEVVTSTGNPPEPVPVTTGEYKPVISGLSPVDILTPLGFQQFAGDQAGGTRIFKSLEDYRQYMDWCDFEPRETQASDLLRFGWLPPGTSAVGRQLAALCPDGALSAVVAEFEAGLSEISVAYWVGKQALLSAGEVARFFVGTLADRPAIISVGTRDGFPHTIVVMETGNGSIELDTRAVPLEDVLRLAEGIECDGC